MTAPIDPAKDRVSPLSVPDEPIPFSEAFRVWLRIGFLSFGGPAGQIALMHRILVEERRWVGEARFLHALNYCMLLPGPEAQQLAIYIGWLLNRTLGGIVAGVLFVLPGALVMLALSALYAGFQDLGAVQAIFFGIKAAVLAVVIEALIRISKRALRTGPMYAIAAGAFVAIFAFDVPFPAIILTAALIGLLGARIAAAKLEVIKEQAAPPEIDDSVTGRALAAGGLRHTSPSLRYAALVAAVCLLLWFGPIVALFAALGAENVFTREAVFFSKMAVVTFGGAYAVLAYVAQQAVEIYGWLAPGEMLDGLGLAETTPGPLILVTQFVGFLGAFRHAAGLDPMLAGMLGALVTTWFTFVPCFLWIFLGAPYVEALRGRPMLNAALSAITAAVVGVILNLAVWFALHVLFSDIGELIAGPLKLSMPAWRTFDPVAGLLALGAALAMLRFHVGMLPTLAGCAALGSAYWYASALL
jgi:chromate transporter